MKHFVQIKKVRWLSLIRFCVCLTALCLFAIPSHAQSNINYAEYFLDQDPGINNGISIPVTPGTDIQNVAVNMDVSGLTRGVHFFGTRSRTVSGLWSMTHYWYIFKPYVALVPAANSNITNVEYFVDTDPGLGSATPISVTAGTVLADLTFSVDPTPLKAGVHIIGTRAYSLNGSWSKTNYWLFYKPFTNFTPGIATNTNYVEYFVDTDPGIGLASNVPVTPGLNLSDVTFPVTTSGLAPGMHIIGTRSKDASGNWSMTNYWLFVKPYANQILAALPNTNAMEYYLDYDPGEGKGIPVSIAPGTNFSDLTFNVDITNIIPGNHFVTVRTKDAVGNWSMVNAWAFNIPGSPPVLTTLVSATTLCAGSSINVGYQMSSPITFNPTNNFIAQLSDNSGSFAAPTQIGSTATTVNSGTFGCVIPTDIPSGYGYRIRVVSTSQPIVGNDNGTNMTIYGLPAIPSILTPGADSTVCQGNQLQLIGTNLGGSPQWVLNNVNIPSANSTTYTVLNAGPSDGGAYKLRMYGSGGCFVESAIRNITINTNVPSTPTISPSGALGLCIGSNLLLTSTAATLNQWYKDGVAIGGATGTTYSVTLGGTYTVRAGNGTGCFATSSNNAVVSVGVPPTTPTVSIGGPTTFCAGGSVAFTSSAFSNNQWLKNGVLIPGATSQTYYANTSGFYKVQASNNGCVVYSDSTQVVVNPNVSPSISIVASTNFVPLGTPITFTATPIYGGANPQYSFTVNSVVVQTGSSNTYTTSSLTNGQYVYCIMTSNAACVSPNNATSNLIYYTVASLISVSGRISTPWGAIIPGIRVGVSVGVNDSTITDPSDGSFNFNLFQQRNYTITPRKNNDVIKAKGVNVLDVLQMQSHILGSTLLNSPYKIIAADVNGDQAINILDVIATKRLILGIDTTFPVNRLWAFVDSLQTFPNPQNPFPYLSSKSYSNLSSTQINQSFYGVKLGDVNFDWAPTVGQNSPVRVPEIFQIYYDTVIAEVGDIVRLRIRVRNFNELMGMQFTLGFDNNLFQFVGVENKLLPLQQNEKFADKGAITFIWADVANYKKTLADGSAIFDLLLLKKRSIAIADIYLDPSYTPALAFGKEYLPFNVSKTSGVILEKSKTIIVSDEKLEVRPNPSDGFVKVSILSKSAKQVTLLLTDEAGRTVLQKVVNVQIGDNIFDVNCREQMFIVAGVYYLKGLGLENSKTKKLVITNR